MNPNGRITTPFIYGNTGIITNFGDGSKVINIKCGQGKGIAYQWESTATNVPPFVVQSTSKVNNLNADLLDGLNTSWDDQSGNSIVRRLNGDSKFDVGHFNNINSANGTFTGAISCDNITASNPSTFSSNVTISGQLTCSTISGTVSNATLADNVKGGANRIPYQQASNDTTTSGNLVFNGTKMTVKELKVNSVADTSISGNANTANLADNVKGSTHCILYQSGNNTTSTTSNLRYYQGKLQCASDIVAYYSDQRLKTDFLKFDNAIEKICSLTGGTFEWNKTAQDLNPEVCIEGERHAGLIAQDVQKILPEAVTLAPGNNPDGSTDYLTIKYEKLVPLLVEAIKELKGEIDELKKK